MKFLSSEKGFTLLELFVVISIVILLSAIVIPNYRAKSGILALRQSSALLSQSIRKVSEKAMASEEYHGIIPSGGYGIYLQKIGSEDYKILLFADCNRDHLYTFGNLCNGFPEKFEEIRLRKGVAIDSFDPPTSTLQIVFQPPDPTVYINGGETLSKATITLYLKKDPTKKEKVSVNKAGLIGSE